ncbi:bifunctional 2-polyprenyl-6-hydroxyphenol methylase/3-demethylubiquinol 3-O-methyltransferase UbiG, partial [Rhizobiaceae sp. 2RAB30]
AAESGVTIDYRATTADDLADAGEKFDVVLNMEVVEHVADIDLFIGKCADMVKPGGIMFVATINRTLKALGLAIVGAEYVLRWLPRGTHQYGKLVRPQELEAALGKARLTVIDRTGICEETSSGNAAAFAFSDVLPLAHKGMIGQVPKWLADPLGPLSIPPAYLPKLLPWLFRFWRAGSHATYDSSLAAQAGLMKLAEAEWMGLMDRSATRGMLRENGSLELYESEAEFQASLSGWAARDRFGIAYRHLEKRELPDYQPGLA